MASNSAFSLQGATPFKTNNPFSVSLSSGGSSPASNALSNMKYGGKSGVSDTTPQYSTFQAPTQTQQTPTIQGSTPGLLPPTSQAVKSHTITNADGSTVQQTYHAPAGTPTSSSGSQNQAATPSPFSSVTSGLIGFGGSQTPTTANAQQGLQNIASGAQTYQGADGNSYYTNQFDASGRPLQAPNQANIQKAQQNLQNLSTGQSPEVVAAEKAYNDFAQQNPYMLAAQSNPNVAADVASGRDALLGQTFAAEQAAKAQQVQNALTGQGQQITAANEEAGNALTGQGQQITAGNNAGNLALTGQGQNINALGTVGGLIPEALRFGDAAGGLNPNTTAQSLAQKVVSGQMTYDDAVSSLGYAGSAGQQFLNSAIQSINPGFNIPVSRGQAAANQSNTTTAGTAATNANAAAYAQNYPAALQIQGYLQNVQDLGQLLVDTASGAAVNPFDLTYANDTLNTFKSKLSDSGLAQFNNTLATYQGAVSQLLSGSTNVNPTQVAEWTKDIANGSMKLETLKDVFNQALKEGNIKLNTAQNLANIPGQQLGAPAVSGGLAGTKGQTSGGNSYTIIP